VEEEMQKVNGAESFQERSTPVAPGAAVAASHNALPPEILEKLKTPLPPEAVSPNPERPGLSVIKVIYVVERLNDVFGLNGWRVVNQVVESGRMVVVKATVTIPEYGIVIEQYGGNDNPDRGDAYKGACTDALSKCASYLGIGMDVYKGLRDERLKAAPSSNGSQPTSRTTQPDARRAAAENGRPEPTGLTTKNMVERFATMRRIIGPQDYDAILSTNGYRDLTNIPSLEKVRDVYRALVNVFRTRYRDARVALGEAEYTKILRELRFSPKAKLSPEQAVRVFNLMTETMYGKQ
jgi:Rad52/22 family double-strand break repair protein